MSLPNGPSYRLRAETDATLAFAFLQLHYPHFWSPSELRECLVIRVMEPDGGLIGYVWGEWDDKRTLRFHGCSAPHNRFPFFTSDLVEALCHQAFFVGADRVITEVDIPKVGRLLRRLGFKDEGGTTFSRNLWTPNGQQEDLHRVSDFYSDQQQ